MSTSERRRTPRFKMRVPLRVHPVDTPMEGPARVSSLDISASGVSFATRQPVAVGQAIQLQLRMPKRIPGTPSGECAFTGRVVRVDSREGSRKGAIQVGVQFLYYEPRGPRAEFRITRRPSRAS
jgi:PilZ domain